MMKIILPLILFSQMVLAASQRECRQMFPGLQDGSRAFTEYILTLISSGHIDSQNLATFISDLEIGKITNPITERKARTNVELQIHHKGLQSHIDQQNIDAAKVLSKIKVVHSHLVQQKAEQKQIEAETIIPFTPINFITGPRKQQFSFDIMDTLVTQKMWFDIFGVNPSQFSHGRLSIELQGVAGGVRLNPNYPVERITWWSALVYANERSKRDGLKPSYDLTGIEFRDCQTPEDIFRIAGTGKLGTKNFDQADKAFSKNNSYTKMIRRNGYRLPTKREMERLTNLLDREAGQYPDVSVVIDEMLDFGWFSENSGGMSKDVGQTVRSLQYRGQPIYDYWGNKKIWLGDELPGGVRPIFGASADTAASQFSADWPHFGAQSESHYLGLRLIKPAPLTSR